MSRKLVSQEELADIINSALKNSSLADAVTAESVALVASISLLSQRPGQSHDWPNWLAAQIVVHNQ